MTPRRVDLLNPPPKVGMSNPVLVLNSREAIQREDLAHPNCGHAACKAVHVQTRQREVYLLSVIRSSVSKKEEEDGPLLRIASQSFRVESFFVTPS